jgi:hypothetical protein
MAVGRYHFFGQIYSGHVYYDFLFIKNFFLVKWYIIINYISSITFCGCGGIGW